VIARLCARKGRRAISSGLPGSKLLAFENNPVRPGHTRLASTSERGESKLLFRPRNKRIVAARTHGPRLFVPFQLPVPPMRILSVGELADVVPVERPHDADARQHRGAAAGRDQDQGFHGVLPLRRAVLGLGKRRLGHQRPFRTIPPSSGKGLLGPRYLTSKSRSALRS
jgi:hypothetical protein